MTATPQIPAMTAKRLPFERNALVEARACVRCAGSGKFMGVCYSCAGWGRLPTKRGRELLAKIAELIGGSVPVDEKRRFDPVLLRHVFAREVRPGMDLKPLRGYSHTLQSKIVRSVEVLGPSRKITFEDGSAIAVGDTEGLTRTLTESEIERADVYLATAIGQGATRAE